MFPQTYRYDLFLTTVDINAIVSTHCENVCLLTKRRGDKVSAKF